MLLADTEVPNGTLLKGNLANLTERFEGTGAIWFCAETQFFQDNGERPDLWVSRAGKKIARPAVPNETENSLSIIGGACAINLQHETNCGYFAGGVKQQDRSFSAAVVYASSGNARTLLTLNPENKKNYLFLSEKDGELTLQDRNADIALSLPTNSAEGRFNLVSISFCNSKLTLKLNNEPTQEIIYKGKDITGNCDAFIGCRSDRPGILKTLGSGQIADVFFWTGFDLFDLSNEKAAIAKNLLDVYWMKLVQNEL